MSNASYSTMQLFAHRADQSFQPHAFAGSSSAPVATHTSFRTRHIRWPGSDNQVSYTVGYDKSNGPGLVVTFHDGCVTGNGSQYDFTPAHFTADLATMKGVLQLENAMTSDGRSFDSSVLTGDTPLTAPIVIPANCETKILLNDGWDEEQERFTRHNSKQISVNEGPSTNSGKGLAFTKV